MKESSNYYGKTWEEYCRYRDTIREHLPDFPHPLSPGVEFGTYKGKVVGYYEDLHLPIYWQLLATRTACEKLNSEGFELQSHEVHLTGKKYKDDLLEIWVPPAGISPGIETCPTCQRGGYEFKGTIVHDSVPPTVHLFRVANNPNFIVFSGEFLQAIERLGLKGLRVVEMPLV
jgi:hypothetical protein